MGLTEKQKNILLQNGWTEEDIVNAPYEEASDAIGEILASRQRKPSQYKKEVRAPEIVRVEKPGFKTADRYQPQDKISYYVSYAKDLCIAMLNAHVEASKIDSKIEPIVIADLMAAAVDAIKKAKAQLE